MKLKNIKKKISDGTFAAMKISNESADELFKYATDNKIPNLIINLIGVVKDRIKYEDFNSDQAEEFLIFLMETAIRLQNFSSNSLTSGILIDYPLRFCAINKENIKMKEIRE